MSLSFREGFFLENPTPHQTYSSGYLGKLIDPFFSKNLLLSVATSTLCAIILALLLTLLNKKYGLIRKRTSLPFALGFLLLSFQPLLIPMSNQYLGLFCFYFAIEILFDTYQRRDAQRSAFDITFVLALGSLFTPNLLWFIPLFLIGFLMMKSFNLKVVLTSVLAIMMLYLPIASYFFITHNMDEFLSPFINFTQHIAVLSMSTFDLIGSGIALSLIILIIINNSVNSFSDKIRVRANISFLSLITATSYVAYLFSPIGSNTFLFVALLTGALMAAHFFALAKTRWKVILFYLAFLFYLALPFLNHLTALKK